MSGYSVLLMLWTHGARWGERAGRSGLPRDGRPRLRGRSRPARAVGRPGRDLFGRALRLSPGPHRGRCQLGAVPRTRRPAAGVLELQGSRRHGRRLPGPRRRSRPRRDGGHVLARVRPAGQGRRDRAPAAQPSGRAPRSGRRLHLPRALRPRRARCPPRRAATAVVAGQRLRLPRRHHRRAGRRTGAPHRRPAPGGVLPPGGRRSPRTRCLPGHPRRAR